jgi:hypothetical protein
MTASPLIKDEKYYILGAEYTKLRWGHCFPCCQSRTNLSYGATTVDQCKTLTIAATSTGCFAASGLLAIFAGGLVTAAPTVPVIAAAATASTVTCGLSSFFGNIWYKLHKQRHKRRGKIFASYNPTSQEATSTIDARSSSMSMQQTLVDCGLRPASEIGPGLYWEFHEDDPTSTPVLVKMVSRNAVSHFAPDGQITRAWNFTLDTVDTSSKGPHLSEAPLKNLVDDWKSLVKTEKTQSLDKEVARVKALQLDTIEEEPAPVLLTPAIPKVPEQPQSESFSATPWPYALRVDPEKIPESTFCIWVPKEEFKGYRLKSHTGPKDVTQLPFNPKFFDIWTSSVPQKSSCKSGAVSVGMYHAMARLHHHIDPRVCYVTKGFGTKDDETPQLYTSVSKSGLFPNPSKFTHLTTPSEKNLTALLEKEGMLPLIDNVDDLIAFEWDLNWGMLQIKAVNASPCKISDPTCHSISVNNVDGIFCHTKYNISEHKAVSKALGVVETKRQCGVGTSGALGWIKIGGQWFYTDIHHGGSPGATGFHNRSSSVGAICAIIKKHEKKKWGPTYSQAFEDNIWGPIERDVRALILAEQTYGIDIEPNKTFDVIEPALQVLKDYGQKYFDPPADSLSESPPKHRGFVSKSQWQKGVKHIAKAMPRTREGKMNFSLARSTVYAAYSDEMAEYDPEAHEEARMMLELDGDSMYMTKDGHLWDDGEAKQAPAMTAADYDEMFADRNARWNGEAPLVEDAPTFNKHSILEFMRNASGPVIVYDLAVYCKRPKKDVRIILHALQNFAPPLVEQVSSQAWVAVESSREHVMEETGYGIATAGVHLTPAPPPQATTESPPASERQERLLAADTKDLNNATLLREKEQAAASAEKAYTAARAAKAFENMNAWEIRQAGVPLVDEAPAILAQAADSDIPTPEAAPAILAPAAASSASASDLIAASFAKPPQKQPSTPDATIDIIKYMEGALARRAKEIAESPLASTPVIQTIEEVAAVSPEIAEARTRRQQKNVERKQRARENRPAPKAKPKSQPKAKALPPTPVGAKAPVGESPPSSSSNPPLKGTPPILTAVPLEVKPTTHAPVVYGTYSGNPAADLLPLSTVFEDSVLVGESHPHSLIRVLHLDPSPMAHLTQHQRTELYYPAERVCYPPPGLTSSFTEPNTGLDSTTMYIHNMESFTPPGADPVTNFSQRSMSPPPCPLTTTRLSRWLHTSPISQCPTCCPTWDGWYCNICGVTRPDKPRPTEPTLTYYVLGPDGKFFEQPLTYSAAERLKRRPAE